MWSTGGGSYGVLLRYVDDRALVRLKSGKQKLIEGEVTCRKGVMMMSAKTKLNAGSSRRRGRRPHVSTNVKNPVCR